MHLVSVLKLTSITINKASGSISGSPWGATSATITWNGWYNETLMENIKNNKWIVLFLILAGMAAYAINCLFQKDI